MEFLEVVDPPVTLKRANGKVYQLPVWTMEEIVPICARLQNARVEKLRQLCVSLKVEPREAAYLTYQEASRPLDMYEAHTYFMSPEGMDECLIASMKKAGMEPDDIKSVLGNMKGTVKQDMVLEVGGLYLRKPATAPATAPSTKPAAGTGLGEETQAPKEPATLGNETGSVKQADTLASP